MPLISNCSMMPVWHQLVSMSGHVEESETARKLQLYATSIYQVHSFVCQLDYGISVMLKTYIGKCSTIMCHACYKKNWNRIKQLDNSRTSMPGRDPEACILWHTQLIYFGNEWMAWPYHHTNLEPIGCFCYKKQQSLHIHLGPGPHIPWLSWLWYVLCCVDDQALSSNQIRAHWLP